MKRYITLIFLLNIIFSCGDQEKSSTSSLQEGMASVATISSEGTRQIHLDFHNHESLEGIGKDFDKAQFIKTLKLANVNSINIFSKCHHGWSYYDTEVGSMHPHLDFDLMLQQIEACKEAGIRVQAYFAVGWSVKDALDHPEWVILDKEGRSSSYEATKGLSEDDAFPTFTWDLLSPEGSYLDLILAHTEELMSRYDLDGMWYDIIPLGHPNYSPASLAAMKAQGIDISDDAAVNAYHVKKMEHFMQSCNDVVKKYKPEASIFYNWSTHMILENTFRHHLYRYNTKLDLEDLPTTWEGYDIFPLRAKYFCNTGMSMTGMSGKFHTAWGEFGGFKYPEALMFEAASMVSMGAHVNFGDQLHPSGIMDEETYRNLKPAFDYVEQIEAYGIGGQHESDLGIWMSFKGSHDEGLVRMLLENQLNFVVANNHADISQLKVIILSSGSQLNAEELERLKAYHRAGGKLVFMGTTLLDTTTGRFAIDAGVSYVGGADFDVDYTEADIKLQENLVSAPFLNYSPAVRVKINEGTEVLAGIREPYFSRLKRHYTSHQNTPYRLEAAAHPAITRKGDVMYMAHELDRMYYEHGARVHRELFINAIKQMYTSPMLEVEMPSSGRVNLLHFPERRQYVLHMLYGPPHQRGRAQVIEDLVPLFDIPVHFTPDMAIKKVYEIPSGKELKFEKTSKGISLILPKLKMHTAIVLEY